MNISKLKGNVTVTFPYRDEQIEVVFRRLTYREAVSKEMSAAFDKIQDEPEAVCNVLSGVMTSWNITDDETGEQHPFDAETLVCLPADFLRALAEAILNETVPNPPKPQS